LYFLDPPDFEQSRQNFLEDFPGKPGDSPETPGNFPVNSGRKVTAVLSWLLL
jgi:hypothetical protein